MRGGSGLALAGDVLTKPDVLDLLSFTYHIVQRTTATIMVHPYFRNKFDLAAQPLGQAPNPENPAPVEPEDVAAPASSPPIVSTPSLSIETPTSNPDEEMEFDDGLDDCSDTYEFVASVSLHFSARRPHLAIHLPPVKKHFH